jgi:hypothetical protein
VRRWIACFLLSAGIAWIQAAITVNAGGSIHHTVLIWPFFYLALALSIATVAKAGNRWTTIGAFAVTTILCIRGIQTVAQTNSNLASYSNLVQWTDADSPLCKQLEKDGIKKIIAVDWGIANVIATETAGRVSVVDETFELAAHRLDKDRFLNCTEKDCLVIAHAPGREIFPAATAFLQKSMRSLNLEEAQESTVFDGHGTPSFFLYRLK